MSKFNGQATSIPTQNNMAGGISFNRTLQKEITALVLNSMLNGDSYYEQETDRLKRIESMIANNVSEYEFIAKAMIYTRNEGKLRSVSHYMAVILLENIKGTPILRKALEKSMLRPDDATEIVSLWNQRNPGKMIPNSLRRAIKTNLENSWDLYQLKKYSMNKRKVKLKDLVKICHPNPKVWNQIFNSK